MGAINQMCQKVLVLDKGQLVAFAPVEDAIMQYRASSDDLPGGSSAAGRQRGIENLMVRGGSGDVRIRDWRLKGADSDPISTVATGGTLECEINYEPVQPDAVGALLDVAIGIDTLGGTRIYTCVSGWQGHHARVEQRGGITTVAIRDLLLRPGTYLISLSLIHAGVTCDSLTHCGAFSVVGPGETGGISWQPDFGSVRFPVSFSSGAKA
jgi:Wzt C-terminal domain